MLKLKNADEAFQHIATHLLTQMKVSRDPDDNFATCEYRQEDGLTCAIGCAIDDKYYSTDMEGMRIVEGIDEDGVDIKLDSKVGIPFAKQHGEWANGLRAMKILNGLQELHDGVAPEHWREELAELATEYNVRNYIPPPE